MIIISSPINSKMLLEATENKWKIECMFSRHKTNKKVSLPPKVVYYTIYRVVNFILLTMKISLTVTDKNPNTL